MKISELVARLDLLRAETGRDLEVMLYDENQGWKPVSEVAAVFKPTENITRVEIR